MKKKVLLINGSPRGKQSNSRKIAMEFLKGMNRDGSYEVEEIVCSESKIEPCRGCFSCWGNEEGRCVIQDDMQQFFYQYIRADLIVWSFPNYYFSMAAKAKIFMERLLPVFTPYIEEVGENLTAHGYRYSLEHQKYLLFCTSGLYHLEQNIDAIDMQFQILYGDKCEKIYCSEGQVITNSFLSERMKEYLDTIQEAGYFYHQNGYLDQEWHERLKKPILEKREFLELVNSQWLVRTKKMSDKDFKREKAKVFVRSMALTYEPETLNTQHSVLEMEIVDCRYRCQLILDKEQCKIVENPAEFEEFRLKMITNLNFFSRGISFKKGEKDEWNKLNFRILVQLLNKYEKQGWKREWNMIT